MAPFNDLIATFPRGTPEFRKMMRNFVTSIPPTVTDVQFGLAEADRRFQELFYTKEKLDEGKTFFMPVDYMQQLYEEFKGLQSADCELEEEDT